MIKHPLILGILGSHSSMISSRNIHHGGRDSFPNMSVGGLSNWKNLSLDQWWVMFVQRGTTGGNVGMFTTSETCGFARYLRLAGLNSEDLSNALNHDIS